MHRFLERVAAVLCLSLVLSVAIALVPHSAARASGLYNRSAAVAYADQWTSNTDLGDPAQRNPAYVNLGNDCTNYLSQVLLAGSYPMHDGNYNDCNFAWWFNWNNWAIYSNSWVNASCFNY